MLRMKFHLDLDCESAAFSDERGEAASAAFRCEETARILDRLASELREGLDPLNSTRSLMDVNGHRVGSAVFREEEA